MKYLRNEEEAKDAVQMVFLKVLTELPRYRVTYFKSWVYMICKNQCLMKLRNKDNNPRPLEEHLHVPGEGAEEKWEAREKERMLSRMDEAVNELNVEQRTCVQLFYLKKLSYHEISEHTGYTMQQVKSHIQNGKRNLKTILQKKPEHER
jgi:RNA polymerase sigma-70 factor (ECF subfamily)